MATIRRHNESRRNLPTLDDVSVYLNKIPYGGIYAIEAEAYLIDEVVMKLIDLIDPQL
ncbi:unknown [[Mannheimia] succiniciproducens MBEL55E]|uniref:Uncharacterized protein n=1 Tax=Mannheimia succiniciproducens (strain KCTC 0769BP / MBEL55E) TaxID=221988 RepID=Q65UV3_MANSM|nr:unknown [[Mannheimia] succiniciproducens MBEL55E]